MKRSHYTTPRQMRDGQWTLGSVSAERTHAVADLLIACIAVAVLAAIAAGVL